MNIKKGVHNSIPLTAIWFMSFVLWETIIKGDLQFGIIGMFLGWILLAIWSKPKEKE